MMVVGNAAANILILYDGERACADQVRHRRRRSHRQDLHTCQVGPPRRSFVENKFPKDYEPTVFDNLTTTIKIDGKIINLGLWYPLQHLGTLPDRRNSEDYARSPTQEPMSFSSPSLLLTPPPSPMPAKKYSNCHLVVSRDLERCPFRS